MLTSNRSRELHDALRRRCLYHWIDFPAPERAAEILRRSVPAAAEPLIASATEFVGRVRELDLDKAPGMAETIDWVSALAALGAADLARPDVVRTLSALAKTPDDRTAIIDVAGRGRPSRRTPAGDAMLRGVDRAAFAVALTARLRAHGVPVGLTGVEDLTRALVAIPPTRWPGCTGSPGSPWCAGTVRAAGVRRGLRRRCSCTSGLAIGPARQAGAAAPSRVAAGRAGAGARAGRRCRRTVTGCRG